MDARRLALVILPMVFEAATYKAESGSRDTGPGECHHLDYGPTGIVNHQVIIAVTCHTVQRISRRELYLCNIFYLYVLRDGSEGALQKRNVGISSTVVMTNP